MTATIGISILIWLAPTHAAAQVLCVSADRANLRAGPGTNFKVTWTVGKYMPLKQVGGKGSWLKVTDLDGEMHWISSSLVSSRLQCVVVKTRYTNLRKRPRSSAELSEIPQADRYTPFKKVTREDAWLLVEDDYKQQFWVADSSMWWPVNRSRMSF